MVMKITTGLEGILTRNVQMCRFGMKEGRKNIQSIFEPACLVANKSEIEDEL
jgi:hypothetical protein